MWRTQQWAAAAPEGCERPACCSPALQPHLRNVQVKKGPVWSTVKYQGSSMLGTVQGRQNARAGYEGNPGGTRVEGLTCSVAGRASSTSARSAPSSRRLVATPHPGICIGRASLYGGVSCISHKGKALTPSAASAAGGATGRLPPCEEFRPELEAPCCAAPPDEREKSIPAVSRLGPRQFSSFYINSICYIVLFRILSSYSANSPLRAVSKAKNFQHSPYSTSLKATQAYTQSYNDFPESSRRMKWPSRRSAPCPPPSLKHPVPPPVESHTWWNP